MHWSYVFLVLNHRYGVTRTQWVYSRYDLLDNNITFLKIQNNQITLTLFALSFRKGPNLTTWIMKTCASEETRIASTSTTSNKSLTGWYLFGRDLYFIMEFTQCCWNMVAGSPNATHESGNPVDSSCDSRCGSILAQVMACCLTASSYYPRQSDQSSVKFCGIHLRAISHKIYPWY